jgi:hypothetical protein
MRFNKLTAPSKSLRVILISCTPMKLIELVTSHPKALNQEGLRLLCQNVKIGQSADCQRGGDCEGGENVFHAITP